MRVTVKGQESGGRGRGMKLNCNEFLTKSRKITSVSSFVEVIIETEEQGIQRSQTSK